MEGGGSDTLKREITTRIERENVNMRKCRNNKKRKKYFSEMESNSTRKREEGATGFSF
jgi:translation initiation factor 2 gamma subunit (eIF-2gamma)